MVSWTFMVLSVQVWGQVYSWPGPISEGVGVRITVTVRIGFGPNDVREVEAEVTVRVVASFCVGWHVVGDTRMGSDLFPVQLKVPDVCGGREGVAFAQHVPGVGGVTPSV